MLSIQVSERVEYYSNKSVHKFAVDSGIITSSTIRILLQTLRMFPYKISKRYISSNWKRNEIISLTRCSRWLIVLISMLVEYGLQTRLIFIWMMSLTDTIYEFRCTENPYLSHARPLYCPKLSLGCNLFQTHHCALLLLETVTTKRYIAFEVILHHSKKHSTVDPGVVGK